MTDYEIKHWLTGWIKSLRSQSDRPRWLAEQRIGICRLRMNFLSFWLWTCEQRTANTEIHTFILVLLSSLCACCIKCVTEHNVAANSISVLTAIFQVNRVTTTCIILCFNKHRVSRCLLKQKMMEVVVTTGAISHAKLQSNHYHQHPVFLQAGCPSCHPTNSIKVLEGNITFHGFGYPNLTWSLPTLSLTNKGSWLPSGGLPCLSSAVWCQYPVQ